MPPPRKCVQPRRLYHRYRAIPSVENESSSAHKKPQRARKRKSFQRSISAIRRDFFHAFADLLDFRMHLADQLMLFARELLDAMRLLVQLVQHEILAPGDTMHPPKTNAPTDCPDHSQDQRELFDVHRASSPETSTASTQRGYSDSNADN